MSRKYEQLIDRMNACYKSSVACYPFTVEDHFDGDTDLQDALAVSTYPPKNWNEIVPMVYRAGFYRVLGRDPGSYLVYSYGHSWKSSFDENISIAISRPDTAGYRDIEELERDAKILESLGYDKVTIFSIMLFIQTHGEKGLKSYLNLLSESREGAITVQYSPLVSYSRVSLSLIDRLL
ncbi:hypothetical protein AKJ37_02380 [candidate division MSBL1 archaeon SCGC-AAA259I09]|uniref:Uncharacterized protein n=2 Tax=candidate division MSBL1 TaxID=215777 RepID=A0A133UUE0_9EURY|nr:hypothetical protein AKJ37_02380 [candidate division MSBL1 archaeon SCGC-AAA259I09]KXA98853.1 hypothetical protein AKJ39_00375 [candidate division MSBL1 archaeon SCGC-AAA259J03]